MIYIEYEDGTMQSCPNSLSELLERMYRLENEGHTVKVRVI